jgi:hypothetical protein
MKDLNIFIKIFRVFGWSILCTKDAMSKNNQWLRERKNI